MNDLAPTPLIADAPVSVTLTATQWNTVLKLLAEGKFRTVAPLIGTIQRQCLASRDKRTTP